MQMKVSTKILFELKRDLKDFLRHSTFKNFMNSIKGIRFQQFSNYFKKWTFKTQCVSEQKYLGFFFDRDRRFSTQMPQMIPFSPASNLVKCSPFRRTTKSKNLFTYTLFLARQCSNSCCFTTCLSSYASISSTYAKLTSFTSKLRVNPRSYC